MSKGREWVGSKDWLHRDQLEGYHSNLNENSEGLN